LVLTGKVIEELILGSYTNILSKPIINTEIPILLAKSPSPIDGV
jgi:hypothetical protein